VNVKTNQMIRKALLACAFVGGVGTYSIAQVSVTTKLPSTSTPGGEFNVELIISKGDVSGFAKLQHELPNGFSATAVETANSTFSFKDRKVKFLWMALPGTPDITVSYKVNVDPSITGNQILEGTFSYIRNNETEKQPIAKDIIVISADQAGAVQAAANQEIIEQQRLKSEAKEAARKAAQEAEQQEGTAESSTESDESGDGGVAAAEEEARRKQQEQEQSDAAARQAQEEADRAAAQVTAEQEQRPVRQEAAPKAGVDAMLKSVPGLVFRVQVAAGPNSVDPSVFASKYGISDVISVEEHEGLFKYVVGEFGSYRPAKTFSNELRDNNGVDGPFVTAYNNGVRIHVKEALDIAGQ